jgi:hypothetical protein
MRRAIDMTATKSISFCLSIVNFQYEEAAMGRPYLRLFVNRGRHRQPFLTEPQPRLLIDGINSLGGLFPALFGLLAESRGVVGHGAGVQYNSASRPSRRGEHPDRWSWEIRRKTKPLGVKVTEMDSSPTLPRNLLASEHCRISFPIYRKKKTGNGSKTGPPLSFFDPRVTTRSVLSSNRVVRHHLPPMVSTQHRRTDMRKFHSIAALCGDGLRPELPCSTDWRSIQN